jgi:hypothetical protein
VCGLISAVPDNGVGIALYAACEAKVKVADKKEITLTETTNYPFSDVVDFTVTMKGKASFPMYLRIPSWTHDAEVSINGRRADVETVSGKYVCINRTWKNGDKVSLRLPMSLSMRRWAVNKNSVSVDYGPLTLSLKIKERYVTRDSKETAIGDSHLQKTADASKWPTTEIYPDSPWNYALYLGADGKTLDLDMVVRQWPADNFPFTLESVPVEFKAKARRVPSWKIDKYGLCGILPDENAPKGEELEEVTLVPMGAARLRISAFPTTKE